MGQTEGEALPENQSIFDHHHMAGTIILQQFLCAAQNSQQRLNGPSQVARQYLKEASQEAIGHVPQPLRLQSWPW